MRLETDRHSIEDVDRARLCAVLEGLAPGHDDRAILSQEDEFYLQTAVVDNGFVIEKREGSEDRHFHAVPRHAPLPGSPQPKRGFFQRLLKVDASSTSECAFSRADMIDIFESYLRGESPRIAFEWDSGYCDK